MNIMNPTDITNYQTTLTSLMATPDIVANIPTIQTLLTQLATAQQTVLAEQTSTDQINNAVQLIRDIQFNTIINYAKLITAYYEYDTEIAAASDPDTQVALITAKQTLKTSIASQLRSDRFGSYMLNLFTFLNSI